MLVPPARALARARDSAEEALLRIGRKLDAGDLGLLHELPEIAVSRAVVELAVVLDRAPVRVLRFAQDRGRSFDLFVARLHRVDDRLDLRRIDRPHAQEAELLACTLR